MQASSNVTIVTKADFYYNFFTDDKKWTVTGKCFAIAATGRNDLTYKAVAWPIFSPGGTPHL
jgi:hypothetical protein